MTIDIISSLHSCASLFLLEVVLSVLQSFLYGSSNAVLTFRSHFLIVESSHQMLFTPLIDLTEKGFLKCLERVHLAEKMCDCSLFSKEIREHLLNCRLLFSRVVCKDVAEVPLIITSLFYL